MSLVIFGELEDAGCVKAALGDGRRKLIAVQASSPSVRGALHMIELMHGATRLPQISDAMAINIQCVRFSCELVSCILGAKPIRVKFNLRPLLNDRTSAAACTCLLMKHSLVDGTVKLPPAFERTSRNMMYTITDDLQCMINSSISRIQFHLHGWKSLCMADAIVIKGVPARSHCLFSECSSCFGFACLHAHWDLVFLLLAHLMRFPSPAMASTAHHPLRRFIFLV